MGPLSTFRRLSVCPVFFSNVNADRRGQRMFRPFRLRLDVVTTSRSWWVLAVVSRWRPDLFLSLSLSVSHYACCSGLWGATESVHPQS